MTVGQLKKALQDVPDTLLVVIGGVDDHDEDVYFTSTTQVGRYTGGDFEAENEHPNVFAIWPS